MHRFQKNDRVVLTENHTLFGDTLVAKDVMGIITSGRDMDSRYSVKFVNSLSFKIHESILKPIKGREENTYTVAKHKAEMLDSYLYAILKCGGSPSKFIENIDKMTVKEMIDGLAQNGVRFTTV